MSFTLRAPFSPTGDQLDAIEKLTKEIKTGAPSQVLLGVTGSGKTFTVASVIERVQEPTLIISHNKTLAAQLYQECKEFFPDNAVHYFVSYYDYYQPEAYIPQRDLYIEKDAKINAEIDRLRHATTQSLLSREDVIVVASVSCIYGIGDPEEYKHIRIEIKKGDMMQRRGFLQKLVELQYERNDILPYPGTFRTRGETIELYLVSGGIIKLTVFGDAIETISYQKSFFEDSSQELDHAVIFPAKHFVTPQETLKESIDRIMEELKERVAELKAQGKILEAQRLETRTTFDMEMLEETGYCSGIENYSRHLGKRNAGDPPFTLFDFFPKDYLLVIDESHITVPQIRGMFNGDRARKEVLVAHGFRLPSALDNRPLTFPEFEERIRQTIYVSATPGPYELARAKNHVVEQLTRPTGILDPKIEIRPIDGQIPHLIEEIKKRVAKKERTLVTVLTKRIAEDLTDYLLDAGVKVQYLHSEVKTLDRPEILRDLRLGKYDVVVGVNLLREGLDLPEVSLVAILDADKEGFLRSDTTLIQTIGRAARHVEGTVIMYADTVTGSMKRAIGETDRRRAIQETYNEKFGITPRPVVKEVRDLLIRKETELGVKEAFKKMGLKDLMREMKNAADNLEFEKAAEIRDMIKKLSK